MITITIISLIINVICVGVILNVEKIHRICENLRITPPVYAQIGKKTFLKRPDLYCIMGWNNTCQKLGLRFDVVFLGDSITWGSDFRTFFPEKTICNLGYPGDNLDGLMLRIPSVIGAMPQQLFVMGGINGLKIQPKRVFENKMCLLVEKLRESLPQTSIYLLSVLPVNDGFGKKRVSNEKIIWANSRIRDIAERNNCEYVDVWERIQQDGILPTQYTIDGLHLNEKGYEVWAGVIKPLILH